MSPADSLIAWLHDPPDKALDIRGHEPRARLYLEAALGRAVTESEQKSLADSLASAIERLPMPDGDDAARRVSVEDGLEIIHPLSAQHADPPAGAAVDEEFVVSAIREVVGPWPDVPERFLALWRLLPERLADRRPYFALLPADTRTPDHTIWQHMDATAALAAGEWGGNAAFLSFSLGPVQSFIAAARSLRDLWSGSMILSWLAFQGMLPVIEKLGPTALVYPVLRGNPFLDRWLRDERKLAIICEPSVEKRRSPCLPNRFVAVVPWGIEGATARELAAQCDRAARAAWARLCAEVHNRLAADVEKKIDASLRHDWDWRWDEQVRDYFDFRVAVLPWKDADDAVLADLLRGKKAAESRETFADAFPDASAVRGLADAIPKELRAGRDEQRPSGQWQYRLELSAKLLESLKSVRHFPPHTVAREGDPVPPKCSLLASFEQMGPALPDAQDLSGCVRKFRELTPRVEDWLARGAQFQVVLDFTGGTKCMSAALALQGRRWRCVFSYVGGVERTKENVGIVVSGKEQIIHAQNPWDALGFQAIDDASLLFDRGVYDAAAELLRAALRTVADPAKKAEINSLQTLAEAYDLWDRFRHNDAMNKLREVERNENHFAAMFGSQRAGELFAQLRRHRALLELMADASPGPTRERIADLIANARRCRQRGRYDDAVARLYRAIEAIAQCRLAGEHQIADTGHMPIDRLPPQLRQEWAGRVDSGTVLLGLQDDYKVLAALNNPLGALFRELNLHDRKKSALTARNQSILAHGFDAVSPKVFDQLWAAAIRLAECSETDLVQFPTLSEASP